MSNVNLNSLFNIIVRFSILIPSIILCYLPMKNQLKFKLKRIICLLVSLLSFYFIIVSAIYLKFRINFNTFLIPPIMMFFFIYRVTLKASISKVLVVYINICTLISFSSHFGFMYDASIHPNSGAFQFSLQASIFQLIVICLFVLILAYPTYRWFRWLIDHLNISQIWYMMLLIPSIFLIFNMAMIPVSYTNLYAGRVFFAFFSCELTFLFLFLFVQVVFYYIATILLERSKLQEQAQLLEIQANSYKTLQEHMLQTARLRHDFKHTLYILVTLANKGDLEALRNLLNEYTQQSVSYEPIQFCTNLAMNALFNHYRELALEANITLDWHIELPDDFSQLDLASLFGNLMDNAITSCRELPEAQRYFKLTSIIRYDNNLFIVSRNYFNGQVKKDAKGYLSTRHEGRGIGLRSIFAMAEKYKGMARAYNTENEFFVEVTLEI